MRTAGQHALLHSHPTTGFSSLLFIYACISSQPVETFVTEVAIKCLAIMQQSIQQAGEKDDTSDCKRWNGDEGGQPDNAGVFNKQRTKG